MAICELPTKLKNRSSMVTQGEIISPVRNRTTSWLKILTRSHFKPRGSENYLKTHMMFFFHFLFWSPNFDWFLTISIDSTSESLWLIFVWVRFWKWRKSIVKSEDKPLKYKSVELFLHLSSFTPLQTSKIFQLHVKY